MYMKHAHTPCSLEKKYHGKIMLCRMCLLIHDSICATNLNNNLFVDGCVV